ncbi:MAG: pyruvate formate-lyase-activating protein [Defluviitaleaceae bacterium]|nr:pyruvate formate-lyase-activating protein [Defluviitaleaceae bacterium]
MNTTENNELTAYIHSVETAGMVDGPGIRYIIFFQGCSLRCKYCHNPDTWKAVGGKEMTVAELLADVKKYRSYLRFSGGGVTITGGEPFVQAEFLIELLAALQAHGIHTALDTSGYTDSYTARKALGHTDLLLLDIKSIDPDVYRNVAGVSIDATLRTLDIARALGVPVWIRFVLVPGLTDDYAHMEQMRDYLAKYPNVEKIEVLPFHKMGEYKWADMGMRYQLTDTSVPDRESLARARKILEK